MKLRSRKNKFLPIVIIAISVLVVAAIVVGVVLLVNENNNKPEEPETFITLSMAPRTQYFVGDAFDPTGAEIQVNTGDMETTYFVKYPNNEMIFSGFDSSKVGEVTMTLTYREWSTTFKITVIEKPAINEPEMVSIRLSKDIVHSYNYWNRFGPNLEGVKIICTYSDGTEVEVPITDTNGDGIYISYDHTPLTGAGTTELYVRYTNEKGQSVETTVTVTITN